MNTLYVHQSKIKCQKEKTTPGPEAISSALLMPVICFHSDETRVSESDDFSPTICICLLGRRYNPKSCSLLFRVQQKSFNKIKINSNVKVKLYRTNIHKSKNGWRCRPRYRCNTGCSRNVVQSTAYPPSALGSKQYLCTVD